MTLENVINEIISHAQKQKEEITDEAAREAEKILGEATQQAQQQDKLFAEETSKTLDEHKKMEMSALNIQLHKLSLEARGRVLDELYDKLTEKIASIGMERKEMLLRLVEKARSELPDAKFVYCNAKDKELISNVLTFGGTIECLGGIVVENADKTIRVNYTFDVLLENVKEVYLNEIAKKIFK